MKLVEATVLALQGKLNEVYVKEYVGSFDELLNKSWGGAKEILEHIQELGLEKQCMDWLDDMGTEDRPVDITELNDYIVHHTEDLYDGLGLDINGNKIQEAKNLNEMKPFEAAKYKDKEWGVFGNKSNAWLVFGTEKEMKAKADELNRQEGNYEPNDEELFAEARSHKEDNEKVAPRTSIEKEYMHNNANFGIYNAKKFNQDSYKEPINAKRNKIRNYKDTETITHTSYEKSPNKQTQLYKDLKDLGYIKSNKKVTEDSIDGSNDTLDESKKLEARNPENDEINSKISKTLNGSTKYMDDLDNAGLGVKVNDKGKADSIYNKAEDENNKNAKQPNDYVNVRTMTKQDLKNSNADTDYYNYLTKNKIKPEVTDTGAFAPTNVFRNSNNFEKTISGSDTTYMHTDRNGVSKAIPRRYKTGNKNYDYDPDTFPKKDYNGVASYEPLDNKELKDFKYAKSQASDDGYLKRTMDKAKAEYDQAKADYDKVNNQVQDVRSKIAKSKANRKTESAEDTDTKNIQAIQDVLKKSGITSERTLDLMSKDILNDLKKNYTKGCKDEYGNYYGTVITDAFRKKVQQITGKMPDLKIGENKKIKEEKLGRNRKIRKKVESLNAPLDSQAYWAYVLGYDFLQDYFKNSGEPECDLTFEKAWEIADDFMHSEEFQDTSKSGYDALVDYLKNKKLIECEIKEDVELEENKEIKTEDKTYTIQANTDKYITYNDIDDLMFIADTLVDEIADYVGNKFDVVEMLENEGVNVTDEESDKAYKIIHQLYDFEGNSEDEHIFYIPYNDDDDIKFLIDTLIDIFLQFGDNEELLNIIDKHYHIEDFNK